LTLPQQDQMVHWGQLHPQDQRDLKAQSLLLDLMDLRDLSSLLDH